MKQAAELMASLLAKEGELRQDTAAAELDAAFGEAATYFNGNGSLAIQPEVLKAFNKLTPGAVWLRSSRYWRQRQAGDEPGRMQPW